jgi:hypothetical protein
MGSTALTIALQIACEEIANIKVPAQLTAAGPLRLLKVSFQSLCRLTHSALRTWYLADHIEKAEIVNHAVVSYGGDVDASRIELAI